jgi:putative molybdopterin biosynthesis protein
MVKKEIFLNKKNLKQAKQIWAQLIQELNYPAALDKEIVPTEKALNRIAAEIVYSSQSSPFYTASAVDGIAVNSSATIGVSLSRPKVLKLGNDGLVVNTGDPLPERFNAVIMIEDVEMLEDGKFRIVESIPPYKNVRLIGEDIGIKEPLIYPNEIITPAHIGVLLAGGITKIKVYRQIRVLIIPTGEEIKKPGDKLKNGDIVDTNSYMIASLVKNAHGVPIISAIFPNDENKIATFIEEQYNNFDIAIIIGGSAKGTKDLTANVISRLGKIYVHGVSIQPGKPVILGKIKGKLAIGMPGFPVSSFIVSYIFLNEALFKLQGLEIGTPKKIRAKIRRPITSKIGVTEFVRVKIGKVKKDLVTVPLKKGAGVLSSVSNADGLLKIPFDSEGIESGTVVRVELLEKYKNIKNQILFIGSNDPLLIYFFSFIKKRHPEFNFGVVNSGSLGGLLAFERGECSITAAHLFDEKTEKYNEAFLKKYVTKKYIVVHFSLRDQGIIVQKGNPKKILSITDIPRPNITFVNRQKGSGTRVITDYLFKKNNIDTHLVKGYEHEEYTHLAVANNIKLGGADCGIGIKYVADALNLDFIPVKKEQYDLIILKDELKRKEVRYILETLKDKDFVTEAKQFKGYKYLGVIDEKAK